MKITITREFTTANEAMEFLARVRGPSPAPVQPEPLVQMQVVGEQGHQPAAKRPRKPRADAGQPRGPYKTTGGAGSPPAGATSPAPQGPAPSINAQPEGAGAPQGSPASAAALAATPSGAASASAAPAKSSAVEPPQAAQAPVAADLTLDAVRETMGKLHKIPGLGMEACIESLKAFGVLRISDLPKEKYAAFDAHIRSQLPVAP